MSDPPVSTLDIYATLTELTNLDKPEHVQGTSLVPILKDPNKSSNRAVVSTSRFRTHVVSGERYRYLSYQDGSEELYDIKNDPHQWYNLVSDPALAEEKAALEKRLATLEGEKEEALARALSAHQTCESTRFINADQADKD